MYTKINTYNILPINISCTKYITKKKQNVSVEKHYYITKKNQFNYFVYIGTDSLYSKNNIINILKKTKRIPLIFDLDNLTIFLGKIKCYYLHGMGYKCNNSLNAFYLSVGKSTWETYPMQKGTFSYTISRKNSWRKFLIKKNISTMLKEKTKITTIYGLKKLKSKHKKRKLRTRVKLLRNYHGLLFMYAISTHQLHKMSWGLQTIRTPNVYTGKGIHYYKQNFKPQERKLKSFFYKK